MIKKQINFSDFCDSFSGTYKNNFSYNGKRALFDYLDNLSDDIGEDIELDPIALCCEYSEYDSALDCIKDAGYNHDIDTTQSEEEQEEDALEYLQDNTSVIEFDGGIIIQDF
jgi:hypothetical protein